MPAPGIVAGYDKVLAFYDEAVRRVGQIPGVEGAAVGSFVPWRDAGDNGTNINFTFTAEGYTPADGEEPPRARVRFVSPAFSRCSASGSSPGASSRDEDGRGAEPVAIVSETPGAAIFPEWRRLEPTPAVDRRQGHAIRAHRGRCRRCGR